MWHPNPISFSVNTAQGEDVDALHSVKLSALAALYSTQYLPHSSQTFCSLSPSCCPVYDTCPATKGVKGQDVSDNPDRFSQLALQRGAIPEEMMSLQPSPSSPQPSCRWSGSLQNDNVGTLACERAWLKGQCSEVRGPLWSPGSDREGPEDLFPTCALPEPA